MKILYDSQVFTWARYAGIPRYYSELITALMKNEKDVTCIYPDLFTTSTDYLQYLPHNKYSRMQRYKLLAMNCLYTKFSKDSTRFLCYSDGIKKSIQLLKNGDFDIFHPTHYDPYFIKYVGSTPFVTTVHDLICEKYPEFNSSLVNFNNVKSISDMAVHIIADSKNTKKEFVEYYDIDDEKVSVVYLASSYDPNNILKIALNKNLTNKPYILVVNTRYGHKNFMTMVVAIAKLLRQYDIELICVGGGAFTNAETKLFMDLNIVNYVKQFSLNNTELCATYKGALCLVFPSLDEGFGLPILDAFACGCPVVLSNASCLPEVGGNAAIYFYPKSLKSIRESVEKVISDEKLREMMKKEGYKQLEKFSWKKCAEDTKKVYQLSMK